MKALVLTFDKYKPFAQHMIMCYEEMWPNNPFTFRIPYQSDEVKEDYVQKFGKKVELIKSPSGIVDTMFALSDDLDENEWVYWCMDDRYPIQIDIKEVVLAMGISNALWQDDIRGDRLECAIVERLVDDHNTLLAQLRHLLLYFF